MRFKKKIFEIGAEMTEKIEIKVLAPFARVHRKKQGCHDTFCDRKSRNS